MEAMERDRGQRGRAKPDERPSTSSADLAGQSPRSILKSGDQEGRHSKRRGREQQRTTSKSRRGGGRHVSFNPREEIFLIPSRQRMREQRLRDARKRRLRRRLTMRRRGPSTKLRRARQRSNSGGRRSKGGGGGGEQVRRRRRNCGRRVSKIARARRRYLKSRHTRAEGPTLSNAMGSCNSGSHGRAALRSPPPVGASSSTSLRSSSAGSRRRRRIGRPGSRRAQTKRR